ncbi:MAG TPA: RNA polymerase factor sigma-54 [Terriglobales bacterium]|nr:RNA polymerase factor sigma-54 [Terriglobales bacterium]
MVMLQHKLNVKLSQRQILTPGLVQMVSVLALNKIELKDMINAEMVENPVLEELEDSVPLIDDVGRREEERDRVSSTATAEEAPVPAEEKKDPFDEIDFGSFFQEYLDPGYRSQSEMEDIERPSFENFLSKPGNLTDHLMWQVGALSVRPPVREAAELIIGNLNEDGYLIATDDELMGVAAPSAPEVDVAVQENLMKEVEALGMAADVEGESVDTAGDFSADWDGSSGAASELSGVSAATAVAPAHEAPVEPAPIPVAPAPRPLYKPSFALNELHEALELVRQLDPPGVACRDLRECLLHQLRYIQQQHLQQKNGNGTSQVLADAIAIVDQHLRAVQMKQHKEIAKAIGRPIEAIPPALEFIKTLDPRPGLQYNKSTTRLIEPDVAFIKHGDEWLCLMNDEDVPQLRLNPAYKRLLTKDTNDKDTRNYVKERYKSAIQLIKNIEQRKQTITKVCYSIVARQQDFLEKGIDQLKPMMIKEVAEEIGVHPSTVSRAVANKYAHTPQGVFELRYFFSESVQGPEGGNTSLLILKRRVKKLIEEEDPARPLTDEQITRILQSQGIQVTRRTVAKYREDMRIPSTHQRRVKK